MDRKDSVGKGAEDWKNTDHLRKDTLVLLTGILRVLQKRRQRGTV